MRMLYLEPATDWTNQTVEERLRLCAETLYVHHLINDRWFNEVTSGISMHADRQRDLRSRNQVPPPMLHPCEA